MEKMNNLQHNQITDDEMEQVIGGRNIFDVFTTEFREFFDEPQKQKGSQRSVNGNNFGVSTLEMRVNPTKDQEKEKGPKVIKL